ncbi:hypothetical protein LWI28_018855 [Acer negundo]|uniref:PGG domain-containing protein n=1 Tax=Acer negundo TaxID=4023 RepID=A0AAD5P294_ACENE|nr:hypothetical protein LWI28_018855 [Acer negundo]
MKGATKDNDIEMARGTSAADSEPNDCSNSEFENEETMMASSSNNRGKSFELIDSLYYDAANGIISKFEEHSKTLDQLLTPNGNTILHIHITARCRKSYGNMNFVTGILGMCPDLLWKTNKNGETLLHMAARHGHRDVAKYLLEECKNTPYQNQYDDQEKGITPTRRMLQPTSHDAKDTALHEAVRYDHLDVVRLLTEEDRELTYEANAVGETPLYLTAERGYTELLKEILCNCSSPGDHGPYDRTALHVAVIRKDEDMVDTLLRAETKIHKSKLDQKGWTPLHFAAHFGYIEILRKLLSKDKSAAYKAGNGRMTALHVAAGLGRVNIMQELISNCPGCCEIVDKRGRNVLHFALESRDRKAVKLILENPLLGNLINEKDEKGNTPFLYAASMGNCFPMFDPRVDLKVFNHHNQNLLDMYIMVVNNSIWLFEMMQPDFQKKCLYYCTKIISWLLPEKLLFIQPLSLNPGLRTIVSENDNIGEGKDEGNRVCESKDGEVDDEGNRMSSKSNGGKGEDRRMVNFIEKARHNELVASTLIATVTFTAGFTVPGGFVADKGPDQGNAILSRNTAFRAFVILNTMSMILSSFAVFNRISIGSVSIHHQDLRKLVKNTIYGQGLINSSTVAMIGAFVSGTCAVLRNDKSLAISACVVPVAILAFLLFYNHLIGPLLLNKYVKN